MRRLPDELQREINRLAHALAQQSFTEHRRRLMAEALALVLAGKTPAEVLVEMVGRATGSTVRT